MRVIRETCVAGSVIDITIKVPSGNHKGKRKPKGNITKETVQKNNDRMAAKELARYINANFKIDDSHDTLTHAIEPSPKEARRIITNFLKRVNREMKKLDIEFKWIIATEYKEARLHHHLVTNAPISVIRKQWKEGIAFHKPLYEGPNYKKLADYIIKETSRAFRDFESPTRTRYSHSRNLVKPEVRREEVSESMLWGEPEPRKGYYIDQDTVRRFEHPVTKLEHLEYMMVSLDDEPRIKKYYRGKVVKPENYNRYINYSEEQLNLEDIYSYELSFYEEA